MRADIFHRLPAPTVILLISSIFDLTSAHVLQIPPLPTATIPHHVLNVLSWPLAATPAPRNPFDLFRRQGDSNTVCGYIGGNSDIPATCSAGSHCVVDIDLNVVGCCPNGVSSCTAGIFTGCVDGNSGAQTAADPYVFTCGAGNVCYKNVFDGGYSQWGCGTASNLATTVLASATGLTTHLSHPTVSVSVSGTRTPSSRSILSESRTISSSQTSGASSTSSTPSSTSSVPPVSPPAPAADRVGPIVGGVIGGVSVFLAIMALLIFFIRRRRGNLRKGPSSVTSDTYISLPKPGPNSAGFTPLAQSQEAFETVGAVPPRPPPVTVIPVWAQDPNSLAYQGAGGAHVSYPPPQGYHYPGQYPAAYAGAAAPIIVTGAPAGAAYAQAYSDRKGKAPLEPEKVPLTRDSRLGRIGEEDEEHHERLGTGSSSGGEVSDVSGSQPTQPSGNGSGQTGPNPPEESGSPTGRPLWQQNRRQSRNQMWM